MTTEKKSDRSVVRVSEESLIVIRQIASEKEIDLGQATDYLIHCAKGRLNALRRDNARRAAGKEPTHRKVTHVVLDKAKASK